MCPEICSWTDENLLAFQLFWIKKQALPWLLHPCGHQKGCILSTTQDNAISQPALSSSLPFLSPLLAEKLQNPQVVQSCHKGRAISPAEDKVTHNKTLRPHSPTTPWLPFCLKGTHSRCTSRSGGGGRECVWECCGRREARSWLSHL